MSDKCDVIAFASGKGGVGKTTQSINTAFELAQTGDPVALLDLTKKQQHVRLWRKNRALLPLPFDTPKIDLDKIPQIVRELRKDYRYILLDTPGNEDDSVVIGAMLVSEMIIVPCGVGGFDESDALRTFDLVKNANAHRESIAFDHKVTPTYAKCAAFLSKYIVGTTSSSKALQRAREEGFKIFDSKIAIRTSYDYIATTGKTIQELAPNSIDEREVKAFVAEMVEYLNV